MWRWAGLLALWIAAPLALASDWFVAVDGRSDGDGSWTRPWNLNTALMATNTVAPGDVVWLRAGEYVGLFECALKGNEFKPVTVRALPGGRCAIIGTISQDVGGWVTFWGMEVCQMPSSRWTDDSGSAPTNIPTRDAIIMRAPGMRFINLVVHDALGDGFALWSEAPDAEVYGCLIYNNGWKGPDRGHGHGIYLQNQTGTKIIRHNLVFNQFGNGIQVYGTSEAFLNRIDVSGNIVFDNGILAETTANNITISGGTPARGITVTSNATYHLAGKAGTVQLGAVGVASWDLTASHNYFAEFVRVSDWTGILWTNNTVISPGTVLELDQTIVPMNEVSLDWDFNRYYQLGTNAWPFSLVTTQSHGYSYDEWQSFTGLDQHTPVTNDRPSENEIVVRSNMFEPGRAWVAIYNWQLASTVNWNPAGILAPGSRYRVFNAQNMAAPLTDTVWNGQPLSFDMTVSEVAQAVGWTNPSPVTAPEFQVFQIVTCPMPHVATLSNQWVAPGATYAAAIESDYAPYPRNLLVYSLDPGAPPDVVISSNGVLEWPVPPGAAPGFQTIPVRVANLQDTNWHTIMPIQVEVLAVTNDPPVLAPPVPAIIPEMIPFETTLSVINPPALGVRFSLLAAPDGVVLNPANGLLQWTPSENQGSQNHTIFYKTTDALFPTLSSTGLLEVAVEEINQKPVLAIPPDVSVREVTTLVLTNQAFDADIPANTLTFSLVSAPAGVQLDPDTGILTWTPSESQGPGVFSISIAVTDDGLPSLGATQTFAVTVKEANSPPNLSVSEDVSMDELTSFVFTNRAADPDIPADILVFSLVSAPAGVQLDPLTGILVWTPTEAQGPGVYRISIAATDNGLPSLSVTQSFSITVRETNSPPQWPPPPEITLHEQSTLILTNQAFDVDIPTNTLTFSLVSAPVGVQLDPTSGVLTWTPTETQGPGVHWIAIAVTDNGSPSLSATQILSVTVREANSAPVLAPPPYVAMNELTTLLLTMQASDSDVPANKLTFSVISAPSGLQLDPTTGVLSWPPSEAQGPATHSITLAVTDNGSPSLSATQRFSVIVYEVNTAPILSTVPDVSVNELATLVITNRANDPDLPANTLTFSLVSAPEGVQLDSTSGVLTWIPTEAQGPGSYPITVLVRDNGSPSLTDTQSFNVTVKESNQTPVLNAPQDISMNELTTLLLTLQASDSDVPANKLTFSVISAPSGLQLDPTSGVLSWTPSEAQGPATHSITIAITDNGSPSLSATQRFSVIVYEVNTAPILSTVPDVSVNELATLVITNRANDPDLPANTLTFSLVSAPEGVQLDSTSGVLTWTPTEAQGPGSYPITVLVRDNGTLSLSNTQSFNVTVKESNQTPVLNAPQDISMNELTTLLLTLQASDSDVPANKLTFSVISAPSGLQLDPTSGVLSWTPSEAQGPATHSITLAVTDNGSPSLSATQRFSVIVYEVNTAPILSTVPDVSVNELATLVITNRANDPDLPANTLTFSLVSAPEGVQLDSTSGVLTWTPTEAQGPGSYPITVLVRDNGTPSLSNTQSFNVTVKESNQTPVLNAPQDISMNELTTLLLTLQASDSDVPANKLTFSVISAPSGLQLDPTTGVLSWTPSEAQGPGNYSITVAVTDNGLPSLSATQSFSVVVQEVNAAPVLSPISDVSVNELTTLVITNRATDPDIPANTLTFSLVSAPEGVRLDSTTGLLIWTPTEAQGPGSYPITVLVRDNGTPSLSNTQSFNVTVKESNQAPVLNAPQDISMNELTTLLLTLQASDSDVPANKLAFSVISAPSGLQLDPTTGVLSWTPSEAQGFGNYSITVAVTDNGLPSLSATQSFSVVVQEVNAAPVLSPISDVSVNELTTLVITNRATDPDLPANTLTFSLVSAPEGVQLDSTSGVLTWTPTEAQGPGSYLITVLVRDHGTPSLSNTQSFNVTVKESNQTPVLNAPQDISMNELTTLLLTLQASDSDVPANKLTFSVISAPSGLQLDPTTGVLSWTPSEAQGPGTHSITIAVTDNGSPSLSATQRFSVIVYEVNTAPYFTQPSEIRIDALIPWAYTVRVFDDDLPLNSISLGLLESPEGMTLDPDTDMLQWTPPPSEAGQNRRVLLEAHDNAIPPLTARLEIPIAINPITPVTLYFLQNENQRLLRVTGNPRLPYTIEYAASLMPPVGWQLVTVTNPGLPEITLTNLDLPGMSCFFRARQP